METVSFDLYILGVADSKVETRRSVIRTVALLTSLEHREAEERLSRAGTAVFEALGREEALDFVQRLQSAGAKVEVRPVVGRPPAGEDRSAAQSCPECGFTQPTGRDECGSCGLVFAKHEREQVREMQRNRTSEEASLKAGQIREEWGKRAQAHLQRYPLAPDAVLPFASTLKAAEVPFLRLDGDEGPLLLTTLRLLALRDEKLFACPYELMADVDLGGGFVLRKGMVRMVLRFRGEVPWEGHGVRQLTWRLTREAAQFGSVVMDWVYARSFMCDACGEGELQYRLQGEEVHGRCIRCAADHRVDLEEALLLPLPP